MGHIAHVSNKVHFLKLYNFSNCKIYKLGGWGGEGVTQIKKKDIVNTLYVNYITKKKCLRFYEKRF